MFSVIFEVLPNEGRKDEYLELAENLKPILETIDGFVDVERYESKLRPGWILSQSTWRDEKSMVRWRTTRASPLHFVQGSVMTLPAPWQVGQVRAMLKKPCW